MLIRREDFGDVEKLTYGSSKKIWFTCEICGIGVLQIYKTYVKQNSGKFCRSCRNKHTANRKDVKKKQSDSSKLNWENLDYRKHMSEVLSKACKKAWDEDDGSRRKGVRNKTPYDKVKNIVEEKGYMLSTTRNEYEELYSKITIKDIYDNEFITNVSKLKRLKHFKNRIFRNSKNSLNNLPFYNVYAHQIEWAEEVSRNKEEPNILEVRCFKCKEWFIPKISNVANRIQYLKGNPNSNSENLFYCSKECKNACSIYRKTPEQIERQDVVRAGRLPWLELTREVQPSLRKMVLERDDYMCIKCNNKENLQCHHIYPVSVEPLLSADVDNCITLCKECHKKVHQEKDGCGYGQLRQEIC